MRTLRLISLHPKLPMTNFLNHSTAHPAINTPVGRRYWNTQGFCNLQVSLARECGFFRQGVKELLLSGGREMARLGFFYLWQGAEDFTGVYH